MQQLLVSKSLRVDAPVESEGLHRHHKGANQTDKRRNSYMRIGECVTRIADGKEREREREISLSRWLEMDIFVQVKRRGEGRFNLSTSHEASGVIKRVHPHMSTYVHIASIHLTVAGFVLSPF